MTDSSLDSTAWKVTPAAYLAARKPESDGRFRRTSLYISVRDGTMLAVDVHLPADLPLSARLPAILNFTPYYRRFALADAAPASAEASPGTALYRDSFVKYGYAVIAVDVRGSGASFGSRAGFRSPREREDYYDIIDWVSRQGWCDGKVGVTGISYLGAAADFAASTAHPALKAAMPTFSVWDSYGDQLYPGGLLCRSLIGGYGRMCAALDQDDRKTLREFAYFTDPHYRGPAPVDDDPDGALLKAALAEHIANFEMDDFLHQIAFRDQPLLHDPDFTSAEISPYHFAEGIDQALPHYGVSGWLDGAGYSAAAITRYRSLRNADRRFLLGPWDHGARTNASPFREAVTPQFELWTEVLRFFDQHLKGYDTKLGEEKPIHYFTIGEEAWKATESWPPQEAVETPFYFTASAALSFDKPADGAASDVYRSDFTCGTGSSTRYERLSGKPVESYYADWHGRDALMLTYTASPFAAETEVTGHPRLDLWLASSARDAAIFAYLEDVAPDGSCRYVTEGMLRALHRHVSPPLPTQKVVGPFHSCRRSDAAHLRPGEPALITFSLLPISWLFRQGHAARIAIAAADRDHFAHLPYGETPVLTVFRDRARPSCLTLPLIRHAYA
jgi:putative CocE/NonD family hydrolase